ncbi:MAG TPA: alpha/beta hydrolase [Anaerolineales bacterium]|nr:alpha/beta hydrolase [Anaerolineales bacterium]
MTTFTKMTAGEAAVTPTQFSTGQVISADGTTIGYRQIGNGPGLVIVHGGARASHHYLRLAEALSDAYTIYLPDRRGRGLSGPKGEGYSIDREIEDLGALLQKTNAHIMFGHSAGGFIALEAAAVLPIEKLALYEPAVSIDGSVDFGWIAPVEKAFARKDGAAAFVIFIKGLHLNWMSDLPYWFLYPLARLMLRDEEGLEMVALLPTVVWEAKEIQRLDSTYKRYRSISADTLLLNGRKSPAYLRNILPALAKTLPFTQQIELPGLNHNAPDQEAPERIASELKQYLSGRNQK